MLVVKNDQDVELEKRPGTTAGMRWLLSEKDGAPTFDMRLVDVDPGGHSHHHRHPWEHVVYVLKGTGEVLEEGGKKYPIGPGTCVLVPPGDEHCFYNTSGEDMQFICCIPSRSKTEDAIEPEDIPD